MTPPYSQSIGEDPPSGHRLDSQKAVAPCLPWLLESKWRSEVWSVPARRVNLERSGVETLDGCL
jgi:hypothetical protein